MTHGRTPMAVRAMLCLSLSALLTPAAHAQTPTAPVTLAYNLGIVSSYSFRGISYSNRSPAVQGGIDASLASGLFAGAWASSIARSGGSRMEVDLYGGYAGTVGDVAYTATVYGYLYPGGHGVNNVELQGAVSRTWGLATAGLIAAYTPHQKNAPENLYLAATADMLLGRDSPFAAHVSLGRENGGFDRKWDWSAGLSYTADVLTLSAAYVDSDYGGALEAGRNGRGGIVLSARTSF